MHPGNSSRKSTLISSNLKPLKPAVQLPEKWHTVDHCWWKRSCTSWFVVFFPIFYKVLHIPWCRISFINSMFSRYVFLGVGLCLVMGKWTRDDHFSDPNAKGCNEVGIVRTNQIISFWCVMIAFLGHHQMSWKFPPSLWVFLYHPQIHDSLLGGSSQVS